MTDYYQGQIDAVVSGQVQGFPLKVKVSGDVSKTNWMNLNKDSAEALKKLCEQVIAHEYKKLDTVKN